MFFLSDFVWFRMVLTDLHPVPQPRPPGHSVATGFIRFHIIYFIQCDISYKTAQKREIIKKEKNHKKETTNKKNMKSIRKTCVFSYVLFSYFSYMFSFVFLSFCMASHGFDRFISCSTTTAS